ncbi:hypothetical protein [Nocardia lijiangensis]|uniref:hypothetical protein n=1 Tax=Nocardia lijiangensis TaxID=299618 RepID=UPI003D7312E7
MTWDPNDPSDDDDAEAWVELPQSRPDLHLVPGHGTGPEVDEPDQPPSPEDDWLVPPPEPPDTAVRDTISRWWVGIRYRMPVGAWAALGATVVILAGVAAGVSTNTATTGKQVQATAVPPSPTTAQDPCAGLSGTVVTDRAGDPNTLEGVIASFEAAYYIDRDASKATALVAPETGITVEGLAAGIAKTPPGARHCVAITPIATGTANVHIVVLHQDRTRVDYLQLINTRPADTGTALLITNFQNNE